MKYLEFMVKVNAIYECDDIMLYRCVTSIIVNE